MAWPASADVVRRNVAKATGNRVWPMRPTARPSGSTQIDRQCRPSIFIGARSVPGEGDQGTHGNAKLLDPLGAAQVGQVDDEGRSDDFAAGLADQLDRRLGGAAGGD